MGLIDGDPELHTGEVEEVWKPVGLLQRTGINATIVLIINSINREYLKYMDSFITTGNYHHHHKVGLRVGNRSQTISHISLFIFHGICPVKSASHTFLNSEYALALNQ